MSERAPSEPSTPIHALSSHSGSYQDDSYGDQERMTICTSDEDVAPNLGDGSIRPVVPEPRRYQDVPLHSVVNLQHVLPHLDRVVNLAEVLPLPRPDSL